MTENMHSDSSFVSSHSAYQEISISRVSNYSSNSSNQSNEEAQKMSPSFNENKTCEAVKKLSSTKTCNVTDSTFIPIIKSEESLSSLKLVVRLSESPVTVIQSGLKQSNIERLKEYLDLTVVSNKVDLTGSYSLKSISSFFEDILNLSHVADSRFDRKISFLDSLKSCFKIKQKFQVLNHEIENNLKKLQNYCQKTLENKPELSLLFSLNSVVFKKSELSITEEFRSGLGLSQVNLDLYKNCKEFFEEYAIGVLLHQYYLASNNVDLLLGFYHNRLTFEIGQKLMKKCFDLLNFCKVQQIFKNVVDVRSEKAFEIFFDFFSLILKKFLEKSDIQCQKRRIERTIKESLLELKIS